jgi:hypothetical protein
MERRNRKMKDYLQRQSGGYTGRDDRFQDKRGNQQSGGRGYQQGRGRGYQQGRGRGYQQGRGRGSGGRGRGYQGKCRGYQSTEGYQKKNYGTRTYTDKKSGGRGDNTKFEAPLNVKPTIIKPKTIEIKKFEL